jgi:hypothetical protein
MRVKLYDCQFGITALIVAWLWRRQGYKTTIGKILELDTNKETLLGYFVTGQKKEDKEKCYII